MEEEQWFYEKDGKISRSVSSKTLQIQYEQDSISGDTFICKVGTGEWVKYRSLFPTIDAPNIPIDFLIHEFAVLIAIAPWLALQIWINGSIFLWQIFRYDISLSFPLQSGPTLTYGLFMFWLLKSDVKKIKFGINSYPSDFKFSNLLPVVYLVRRALFLRRTYQRTNWITEALLIVNIWLVVVVTY